MKIALPALLFASLLCGASYALAQTPGSATAAAPNPFGTPAQTAAPAPKKSRRAAPALRAGQFASEAEAKANCAGDAVVWANTATKVYHHAGTHGYGTTKRGAYMCEKETAAAGIRAAKNERRK